MYSLDLPLDVIAQIRDAARDADISAARTFGFGGSNWDVDRPSGVGIGSRTRIDVAAVAGLAYLAKPSPVVGDTSQARVLSDQWYFLLLSGTLKNQDVITSVSDTRYVFTVESLEAWYEYERAKLVKR